MKRKILLVDDEAISTMYFGAFLRDQGFDVATADSAERAIALGREMKPDVLITDWMLKDNRDGIDVAEDLYRRDPNIQIIFITGMAADIMREKIPAHLKYSIVEKPISVEAVIQLIGAAGETPPDEPR